MAIQPMALAVQNVQGNALGAFADGQNQAQQQQMNQMAMAQQSLKNIGSLAFGVMGGKLDGQADPAKWEEALDMLGQTGMNVDAFRGRADIAPIVARASVDALGQMNNNLNQQELDQRIKEFSFQVQEALKGPKPTSDQQNFTAAQADPAFASFLTAKDAPNPPAQVGEYNFYAEQETKAGRQPLSFMDFQAAQKGGGLTVTTNPDGTTTVQQGGGNGLKLTEGQGKDLGFYTRGSQANQGLSSLEGELTNFVQQNTGSVPLGLGNYMRTPEFRQAKVEADNFLTALLRKDTGAAISDKEFDLYGPMFLPVPGDDPATINLKRQKRATALLGLRSGLGTAEIVAATNEQALNLPDPAVEAAGGQIAPAAAAIQTPTIAAPGGMNGDPMTPAAGPVVATIPTSPAAAPAGDAARPMTDADYNALPSGALFIDPDDGLTYTKP